MQNTNQQDGSEENQYWYSVSTYITLYVIKLIKDYKYYEMLFPAILGL